MIQDKKCKSMGKSAGFKSCGKLVPTNTRRYGLCCSCYPKFIMTTDAGKVLMHKAIFKVQKPRLEFETYQKSEKDENALKKAKNVTKVVVHAFVRERDKFKPCISCDREWNNDFEAGHHYPGGSYETLKYSLENIHGQCFYCNNPLGGNFDNYALRLPSRIGKERYDNLVALAQIDKQFTKVWNIENLKEIREQVKKLKNELINV